LAVVPEPTDEFVRQRDAVMSALATDEMMRRHAYAWLELVCIGLQLENESATPDSIPELVRVIREQQPSFPSNPLERLLDLRVTGAAALIQYLKEPPENEGAHREVVAAIVIAATFQRRLASEPRYAAVVQRLRVAAQGFLDNQAVALRERRELPTFEVKGGDHDAVAAAATAALRKLSAIVSENMLVDREELQLLWWVFGRHSSSLRKPFTELVPGDAAFASAVEVGKSVLLPPMPATRDFLRVVNEGAQPIAKRHLMFSNS
jgi:hypothetical protein